MATPLPEKKGHGAKSPADGVRNQPAEGWVSSDYYTAYPHTSWVTDDEASDKIFEALMVGSDDWDGDECAPLPSHPNSPTFSQLVFRVSNRQRMKDMKHELPTPTWVILNEDLYFGYVLFRVAEPKPAGEKKCPVNLVQQIQNDMAHAYGLEKVDEVPFPDPAMYELGWSGRDWSLHELKRWQKTHGFHTRAFTDTARAIGGANSKHTKQVLGRLSDMRAYAMSEAGWDKHAMTVALGKDGSPMKESYLPKKLARAAKVPDLTPEQWDEALEYARSKGLDISPIMEHIEAEPVTVSEEETTPEKEIMADEPVAPEPTAPEPSKVSAVAPEPSTPIEPAEPAERHTAPLKAITEEQSLKKDSLAIVVDSLDQLRYADAEIVTFLKKKSLDNLTAANLPELRAHLSTITRDWDYVIEAAKQNEWEWMNYYQHKDLTRRHQSDNMLSWSNTDSEFADLLEAI